jgi:signal recognition particle subunit SEC65
MKKNPRQLKDHNKRIRNSIPTEWVDICDLLPELNFQLIKIFYENEFKQSPTDWSYPKDLKQFSKWLEKAYHFVKVERPKIKKEIIQSIPDIPIDDLFPTTKSPENFPPDKKSKKQSYSQKSSEKIQGKTYKQIYGKSIRLEKKLDNLESKFLKELIDYRSFFWT